MPPKNRKKKSRWLKPEQAFRPLNRARPSQGSSMIIQFFEATEDNASWIGKSMATPLVRVAPHQDSTVPLYFEEHLELLGMKCYELLGVKTPQVALSPQPVPEATLQLFQTMGYSHPSGTKCLHLMSRYIEGFHEFGPEFVQRYRTQKYESASHYVVEHEGQGLILKGFGALLAVANYLHDIDCLGNSGGNIGYVIEKNEQGELYAQTVKIDPGFSFSFIPARAFKHDPKRRDVLIGTMISSLHYDDLMDEDRKEFIQKIQNIISFPVAQLTQLIETVRVPQGLTREHAIHISQGLELRRARFVAGFSSEIQVNLNQEERRRRALQALDQPVCSDEETAKKINELRAQVASYTLQEADDRSFLQQGSFQLPNQSPSFVGRLPELSDIATFFTGSSDSRIINNTVTIVGMGGMGKSQLARQYSHLHREEYNAVVWFHAEAALEHQFRACAKSLFGVSENVDVKQLIQKIIKLTSNLKVLWVFDNVEEVERASSFLISEENHHVLITSRVVEQRKCTKTVTLLQFSAEEGLHYIKSEMNIQTDEQNALILKLLETLDFYPLALVHAICYIKKGYATLKDYPALYHFHQLNIQVLDLEVEYETVIASILISLRKVMQLEPLALKFLQYATCFPPECIQLNLMASLMKVSLEAIQNVAQLLAKHSLIKFESKSAFDIHRIVGRLVLSLWTDTKEREKAIEYVMNALPSSISNSTSKWASIVGDLWQPLTEGANQITDRKNRLIISKFISNKDYHELMLFTSNMQDEKKINLYKLRENFYLYNHGSFMTNLISHQMALLEPRVQTDAHFKKFLLEKKPDFDLTRLDDLKNGFFDNKALLLMSVLLKNKEKIGLNLNYHLSNKKTALHYAGDANNEVLYNLLLKHGADESRVDCDFKFPSDCLAMQALKKSWVLLVLLLHQIARKVI